tara:strand:- start:102 stop:515 length:414 start_codon:yes stop_codon:yes gene_type:complete
MDKFGLNRDDFESYTEYRKEYNRLHRQTSVHKEVQMKYSQSEKRKLSRSKWKKSELGRKINRLHCAKRYALQKQATPPWADLEAIKEFYDNTPPGKNVDHEYAIQGENFSGLHIVENLQYLTPKENSAKGNKLPKEY